MKIFIICSKAFYDKVGKIERVFINSYDWRRKVYNSAGFETIDTIGFWYKNINYCKKERKNG